MHVVIKAIGSFCVQSPPVMERRATTQPSHVVLILLLFIINPAEGGAVRVVGVFRPIDYCCRFRIRIRDYGLCQFGLNSRDV